MSRPFYRTLTYLSRSKPVNEVGSCGICGSVVSLVSLWYICIYFTTSCKSVLGRRPLVCCAPELPLVDQVLLIMGCVCDPDCGLVNFVILGYLTRPLNLTLTDDCLPQLSPKCSQLFSREPGQSVSHAASHPSPPNQPTTESQTWRNKLQSQAWRGR